jgi:hypothetical protein
VLIPIRLFAHTFRMVPIGTGLHKYGDGLLHDNSGGARD